MDTFPAQRTHLALAVLVRLLALAVAIGLLVGFGWWVWEYLVGDPLPYRDPEAIEPSATAIALRVL